MFLPDCGDIILSYATEASIVCSFIVYSQLQGFSIEKPHRFHIVHRDTFANKSIQVIKFKYRYNNIYIFLEGLSLCDMGWGLGGGGHIKFVIENHFDTPVTFNQASMRNIVWDIDSKDLSPVLIGRNCLDVTKLTWGGGLTLGLVT